LGDDYRIEYVEQEPRGLSRYLSLLFGRVAMWARHQFGWQAPVEALLGIPAAQVERDLALLSAARKDPLTTFSYCFCGTDQSR
jgi:hypothetical protein